MADTLVILGGIVFTDYAIPEKISFGGKQNLKVHELIGGLRQVDALGASPDEIMFRGKFRGPGALANAQAIDAMRIAGLPVPLTWLGLNYLVIVAKFGAETEKFYEVPYTVTCTVVTDPQQVVGAIASSLTALVSGDMSSTMAIPAAAAISTVASLSNAIAAQPTLDGAPNSVIGPLRAGAVTAQLDIEAQAVLNDAVIAAGVPIGSPASTIADALLAQQAASQTEYDLLNAGSLVSRIGVNLATGAF